MAIVIKQEKVGIQSRNKDIVYWDRIHFLDDDFLNEIYQCYPYHMDYGKYEYTVPGEYIILFVNNENIQEMIITMDDIRYKIIRKEMKK